jgi:ABC-type transport system involved in cytochrome c biogenesis permease subunit
MKTLFKILPWFFLALFATEIIVVMLPKREGEMHTAEFGRLPVLMNGRIQPFDSVARNSLLQIRSTGDVPLEIVPSWQFWHHPKKLKSTEWLLEVFFKPQVADTRPIFLIHHPEIVSELKLEEKGVEKSGLRYYTYEEIEPVIGEIGAQATKAGEIDDAQRTTYQKQMLKVANAVFLYRKLKNTIQPEDTHNFAELIEQYRAALPAGLAAFRAQQSGGTVDDEALRKFSGLAQRFDMMAGLAVPLTVPPLDPKADRTAWLNVGTSLIAAIRTGEIHPVVVFFGQMATAYAHDKSAEFNSAVAGYKDWLAPAFAKEVGKGGAEFYFNQVKAFLHATIIYIFALVLACGALLTYGISPNLSESLRRSAFYLIGLAFVVHTFGLIYRMVLEGRPPVTNLYSSAIFIGWGACVLGLVLERIYKVGLGSAVAALAGFITLLIAHNLALGGDTMEMMRAVLDTNFWLATHVVVVTFGYASTFVAGTLAMAYIILGIFTPLLGQKLNKRGAATMAVAAGWTTGAVSGAVAGPMVGIAVGAATAKGLSKEIGVIGLGTALTKMVYAIVCFATLFSFTGTVLGGIWADQSWGRFWGWDPKENGALLIVIWNVIILHARWGGLVKERGLMNLAIFGNVVTAWSWFGVNMLGIGLHSYGFMDSAFRWLMLFDFSQVVLIILGCLPLAMWRSFQSRDASPPSLPKSPGGKSAPAPAGA